MSRRRSKKQRARGTAPLKIVNGAAPSSPQHAAVSARYFNAPGSGGGAALFSWRPALRDARDDVREAYVAAAARAVETLHNSGWIAGAVNQAVASTIGEGLRLQARPDRVALGWTESEAQEWQAAVERQWVLWSESSLECDAAGKSTVAELTAEVLRSHFAYGEAFGLLPHIRRSESDSRTKVQLFPAHRLVQDSDDTRRMFQGVTIDRFGLPIGYRICVDRTINDVVDIAARDGVGRPQVVHVAEFGTWATRGITPLAPVLRIVRQFDQLADATLTAALIQAIFAATVESDAPTEQMLQALQEPGEQGVSSDLLGLLEAKAGWYKNTRIDLGTNGRLAHLFPGEKLTFNRSEHPNETYDAFSRFLLREIARGLGLTFETFTGDYTGATYSSVRMATAENWPIILRRRKNIAGRFCQHVYDAWIEEQIEAGNIPFPDGLPGFLANRAAATSADWRGPAKPQADDFKSARAHEVYKRLGVVTDEMICADLGVDWEDVMEQRAREMTRRKQLGLPETDTMETEHDAPSEERED